MNFCFADARRCAACLASLLALMTFLFSDVRAQTDSPPTAFPTSPPTPVSKSSGSALTDGANAKPLSKGSFEESWTRTIRSWLGADRISSKPTNLVRLLNIMAAVLIGGLGALAFYAGVKFGFISPESRKNLLSYLPEARTARPSRTHFYFLGGVVAGIFQWAQPDVLAPIQAFVLGATWPSVVTRIMSGSNTMPPGPSLDDFLNKQPPKAAGANQDAVVVINASSSPPPASGNTGEAVVQVENPPIP